VAELPILQFDSERETGTRIIVNDGEGLVAGGV
jgi:hypothetical protein